MIKIIGTTISEGTQSRSKKSYACMCFAPELIFIGTKANGTIYVYEQQQVTMDDPAIPVLMINSTQIKTRKVDIVKMRMWNDEMLGFVGSDSILRICEMVYDKKRRIQSFSWKGMYDVHQSLIGAFVWAGNKTLYSGDENGIVYQITVGGQAKKVLDLKNDPIVQMEFRNGLLLVSTMTKTLIVDTKEHKYKPIGTKLRQGSYGACFQSRKKIYYAFAGRPGKRLWMSDLQTGDVKGTLKFQTTKKVNFGEILTFGSHVLSWNQESLILLDVLKVKLKVFEIKPPIHNVEVCQNYCCILHGEDISVSLLHLILKQDPPSKKNHTSKPIPVQQSSSRSIVNASSVVSSLKSVFSNQGQSFQEPSSFPQSFSNSLGSEVDYKPTSPESSSSSIGDLRSQTNSPEKMSQLIQASKESKIKEDHDDWSAVMVSIPTEQKVNRIKKRKKRKKTRFIEFQDGKSINPEDEVLIHRKVQPISKEKNISGSSVVLSGFQASKTLNSHKSDASDSKSSTEDQTPVSNPRSIASSSTDQDQTPIHVPLDILDVLNEEPEIQTPTSKSEVDEEISLNDVPDGSQQETIVSTEPMKRRNPDAMQGEDQKFSSSEVSKSEPAKPTLELKESTTEPSSEIQSAECVTKEETLVHDESVEQSNALELTKSVELVKSSDKIKATIIEPLEIDKISDKKDRDQKDPNLISKATEQFRETKVPTGKKEKTNKLNNFFGRKEQKDSKDSKDSLNGTKLVEKKKNSLQKAVSTKVSKIIKTNASSVEPNLDACLKKDPLFGEVLKQLTDVQTSYNRFSIDSSEPFFDLLIQWGKIVEKLILELRMEEFQELEMDIQTNFRFFVSLLYQNRFKEGNDSNSLSKLLNYCNTDDLIIFFNQHRNKENVQSLFSYQDRIQYLSQQRYEISELFKRDISMAISEIHKHSVKHPSICLRFLGSLFEQSPHNGIKFSLSHYPTVQWWNVMEYLQGKELLDYMVELFHTKFESNMDKAFLQHFLEFTLKFDPSRSSEVVKKILDDFICMSVDKQINLPVKKLEESFLQAGFEDGLFKIYQKIGKTREVLSILVQHPKRLVSYLKLYGNEESWSLLFKIFQEKSQSPLEIVQMMCLCLQSDEILQILHQNIEHCETLEPVAFKKICQIASYEMDQLQLKHDLLEIVDSYMWTRKDAPISPQVRTYLETFDSLQSGNVENSALLPTLQKLGILSANSTPTNIELGFPYQPLKRFNEDSKSHWGLKADLSRIHCGMCQLKLSEEIGTEVIVFPCFHGYHKDCLHRNYSACQICKEENFESLL